MCDRNQMSMPSMIRFTISALFLSLLWVNSGLAQVKENLDLPYDAIGEADDEEDAPEVVSFYGQNYEGDGFFYIIDRSGTMQNLGELAIAKREVVRNITEFNDRVKFGVFFFDRGLLQWPSNGQAAEANPSMRAAGIAYVMGVAGGGGTCGMKAISAALKMANTCSARRKVIVFLSDGGGHCEGQDPATYLRETLAAASAQNYNRIQINTIGVLDMDALGEQFMRNLAATNGGTYARINR